MKQLDHAAGENRPTDDASAPTPAGPAGLPLLGSAVAASRDGVGFAESLAAYGDVVSYRAFGEEFVAVFDPEVIETVLVSRSDAFRKGDFEMAFGDLIAPEGLAFAEGEQWRRQRTALQSAFTPDRVASYAGDVVAVAAETADDWADGEVVELREASATLTLRVLTRALFDLGLDAERGAVVREAAEAVRAVVGRFGRLSVLPDWLPTRTERRHDRAMTDLDALVDALVAERRAAARNPRERDDLLSLLVAAADDPGAGTETEHGSKPEAVMEAEHGTDSDAEHGTDSDTGMDPEAVRDQLVTFLFAGHETTATALTYACWLLAGHSDARERLDAELDAVLGDRDPAFADLSDLAYVDAVVREALRLYPPVYAVYRQPREDVVLGGYRIGSDATLQLSTYNVQRDDRWWTDPEEFRPERWLGRDDASDDRPEYAYFPFGGGPRHCIGMRFALTELELALVTLARRVEFERVTDDLDLSMGVTLDPGPVEVTVRKNRE